MERREPSSNRPSADGEPLAFLVGPTGAGKSNLALELAQGCGAALLALDSMQVYRGMDVGTAKPSRAERERVPHHLLDLAEPCERYDVRRYLGDFERALGVVRGRGEIPLVVGGTGLYLKVLVYGLLEGPGADERLREALRAELAAEGSLALHEELRRVDRISAERIHPRDEKRLIRALEVQRGTGRPLSAWQNEWGSDGARPPGRARRIVALELATEELDRRILERTRAMLDAGWPEEARAIRDGVGFGPTSSQALGYREALALADGRIGRDEAVRTIALRTRQLARRQRTWFRQFREIVWISPARPEDVRRELRLERSAAGPSGA